VPDHSKRLLKFTLAWWIIVVSVVSFVIGLLVLVLISTGSVTFSRGSGGREKRTIS